MGFFGSLKQRLRKAIVPSSLLRDIEAIRLAQGRILVELNRPKGAARLRECEFRVFSQWGEDGIIQKLIQGVPIANRTFIEFGVEDFSEANCRFLLMNDNWRGYVMDGSAERVAGLAKANYFWKHDLNAAAAFVTRENVNGLLLKSGFDPDLGILSIDVDGVDYWILEAITSYSPRILIVEYNALFGSERAITVPYDPQFSRRRAHYSDLYFGASLAALVHLAEQKGYGFVGTESAGVNAFFVRNDVMGGGLRPLTAAEGYTESMVRQGRDANGRLTFLDNKRSYELINGLPVVNVLTGATEQL